jgi:hypothetical protein
MTRTSEPAAACLPACLPVRTAGWLPACLPGGKTSYSVLAELLVLCSAGGAGLGWKGGSCGGGAGGGGAAEQHGCRKASRQPAEPGYDHAAEGG